MLCFIVTYCSHDSLLKKESHLVLKGRRYDKDREGWMDEWIDRLVDRWMNGWMDRLVDGWMDGWMDRLVDEWMDG